MTPAAAGIPDSLLRHLVEAQVIFHACVGSSGRLRPATGAECQSARSIHVRVVYTTLAKPDGRFSCSGEYPPGALHEGHMLVYVACVLDVERQQLIRLWFVPSAAFHRLATQDANRERVALEFSCRATGDPRWDAYEVSRQELGRRLLQLVDHGNGRLPHPIPGAVVLCCHPATR